MTHYHRKALVTLVLVLLLPILAAPAVHADNPWVTIFVDLTQNRHAIDPNIYGVDDGDTGSLLDLNCPISRQGGANTSTYNWKNNASNHNAYYFWESQPGATAVAGEQGDTFISQCKAAGAQAMLTIPMLDWVAKLGPIVAPNWGLLWSFSLTKYAYEGTQTASDGDAGNGILKDAVWPILPTYVINNDANDAYVPSSVAFQVAATPPDPLNPGWVQHLIAKWGLANAGGLRYYLLDNEPAFWYSDHRDVHPTGATMDEVFGKMTSYAVAIKQLDPGALIVGPEESSWDSYLWSGSDQQYYLLYYNDPNNHHTFPTAPYPDQIAHGGSYYIPWLLGQMSSFDKTIGYRVLDVVSMHYYPSYNEYPGNDLSDPTKLLRNVSTRSLWDPTYVDVTTGTPIALIPSLKSAVNTAYAGNPEIPPKVAITEYDWGAETDMNGATAQADVLGIFGWQGLDMAARWECPASSSLTYNAMKMYRNYDGNKSTFGDTSVDAYGPDPDSTAVFAAQRSTDGAMTIMVINKVAGQTPVEIWLGPLPTTWSTLNKVSVWQLTAANSITRLPDIQLEGTWGFDTAVPGQSITLFVVKPPNSLSSVIELLLGN